MSAPTLDQMIALLTEIAVDREWESGHVLDEGAREVNREEAETLRAVVDRLTRQAGTQWQTAALLKDRTRWAIRNRAAAGEPVASIAEDYGVPEAFVASLCSWQLFADPAVDVEALPARLAEVERFDVDGNGYSWHAIAGEWVKWADVAALLPPQEEPTA